MSLFFSQRPLMSHEEDCSLVRHHGIGIVARIRSSAQEVLNQFLYFSDCIRVRLDVSYMQCSLNQSTKLIRTWQSVAGNDSQLLCQPKVSPPITFLHQYPAVKKYILVSKNHKGHTISITNQRNCTLGLDVLLDDLIHDFLASFLSSE